MYFQKRCPWCLKYLVDLKAKAGSSLMDSEATFCPILLRRKVGDGSGWYTLGAK